MKKKSKLSRKLSKIVHETVSQDLEIYDMHKLNKRLFLSSEKLIGE